MIATVVDVVVVKCCRISVRVCCKPVVEYVVGVVYSYYNTILEVFLYVVLYHNRRML